MEHLTMQYQDLRHHLSIIETDSIKDIDFIWKKTFLLLLAEDEALPYTSDDYVDEVKIWNLHSHQHLTDG